MFTQELHIRALGLEQLLEAGHSALTVFIVRRNGGPALGGQFGCFFHQHGRLHVSAGAQAEGVAVALAPDDGVGERLAGHKQFLVLLRMVSQRQANVREETTREHIHFFSRCQLHRMAQSLVGFASVVTRNDLDLAAQQAASGIDFFHSQLPALFVGLGKLGNGGVAIDLANLDGGALRVRSQRGQGKTQGSQVFHSEQDRSSEKGSINVPALPACKLIKNIKRSSSIPYTNSEYKNN